MGTNRAAALAGTFVAKAPEGFVLHSLQKSFELLDLRRRRMVKDNE